MSQLQLLPEEPGDTKYTPRHKLRPLGERLLQASRSNILGHTVYSLRVFPVTRRPNLSPKIRTFAADDAIKRYFSFNNYVSHLTPFTAFLTSALILASSAAFNSFSAKATGHMLILPFYFNAERKGGKMTNEEFSNQILNQRSRSPGPPLLRRT